MRLKCSFSRNVTWQHEKDKAIKIASFSYEWRQHLWSTLSPSPTLVSQMIHGKKILTIYFRHKNNNEGICEHNEQTPNQIEVIALTFPSEQSAFILNKKEKNLLLKEGSRHKRHIRLSSASNRKNEINLKGRNPTFPVRVPTSEHSPIIFISRDPDQNIHN